MTATHGIPERETFERKQAAIDQRETARVEALVQVCRLMPDAYVGDTRVPRTMELAIWAVAIQHDMIEDDLERRGAVASGLYSLALRWRELPIDVRATIVAGIIPAEHMPTWDTYTIQVAIRGTLRTQLEDQLWKAILEETPADV